MDLNLFPNGHDRQAAEDELSRFETFHERKKIWMLKRRSF